MIYIASSIYDIYHIKEYRYIETLTTFINTNEPRRKTLLETIDKIGIPHININNCFNKDKLQVLYKDTKVLINIHQTPHHDTFEELRILPALQCGVLVVCENSPLNELIPYNDYIIWSDYDSIVSKVKDVLENYDHYYKKIFGNLHAKKIQLSELNAINYKTLYDSLIKTSISLV
jgi:hypothetical protein